MNSRKERNIVIELTDEEVDMISIKCGLYGLSVSQLLELFIVDLVRSERNNGTLQCNNANNWFDYSWFGYEEAENILSFLLSRGYDIEDFMNLLDDIQEFEESLEEYERSSYPSEYDAEEMTFLQDDLMQAKEELNEIQQDFKKMYKDSAWNYEIQSFRKWYKEREGLMSGRI